MTEELDDVLHDAAKKLEKGAPKQALKRLERAAAIAPDDPDVLALRGRALLDLGRADEARGLLERAAAHDPPSCDALVELAWLALEDDDDDDEEEELSRRRAKELAARALAAARTIEPRDRALLADAHAVVLEAIFDSGTPAAGGLAAADDAARDLGDDDALVHEARGRALFYSARWDDARKELEAATARDKKAAMAHHFLGCALERLDRLADADAALARAAKLAPESFNAPHRFDDATFDAAVESALEELPQPFRDALGDTYVIVREDFPPEQRVRDEGTDPLILGEFIGASLLERTDRPIDVQQDTIFLYRRNLEKECATRAELAREIRITLFHEIGHALGFEHDGLEELGLE